MWQCSHAPQDLLLSGTSGAGSRPACPHGTPPRRAQGPGTLTQPVAGVPLEEGSQQTLGLHAEELGHTQLGSAKQVRLRGRSAPRGRLLQALPSCSVSTNRPTGTAQSDRSSAPCRFGCRAFCMESQWGHQRVFVYVGCTY